MKHSNFFIKSAVTSPVCLSLLFLNSQESSGWGGLGHETVAKLAEMNLKPSVKKKVEKYLDGHSIIYYARWMDQVRNLTKYRYTSAWHMTKVDSSLNYIPSYDKKGSERGDAVYAIERAKTILKDYRHLPDSVVAFNIKCLLHFVGDMHCPSHVSYKSHATNFKVKYSSGKEVKLHQLWDSGLINGNRTMSSTEWAAELDRMLTSSEKKKMAAGTPRDWIHDNAVRCESQFGKLSEGQKLDAEFSFYGMDLIETQISYGGIRLASILNELFR